MPASTNSLSKHNRTLSMEYCVPMQTICPSMHTHTHTYLVHNGWYQLAV